MEAVEYFIKTINKCVFLVASGRVNMEVFQGDLYE